MESATTFLASVSTLTLTLTFSGKPFFFNNSSIMSFRSVSSAFGLRGLAKSCKVRHNLVNVINVLFNFLKTF